MKNILNTAHKAELYQRLDRLISEGQRQWGKMTKEQVICHMADQLRLISGEIEASFEGNMLTRTLLKGMVLLGVPAPPEKISTYESLDYTKDGGTPPTTMEADIGILKRLIGEFVDGGSRYEPPKSHSIFGPMTRGQWGRMVYIHMDHHLKQFNV
ncbi:MAG: DUF1569 domain-containing protein [Calditrichota bacterium]